MLKLLSVARRFDLSDGIIVMQPALRIYMDELWSEFGKNMCIW